ncbi:hypothetical protein ACJZ2D_017092 [Fusarium nematophilum]
MIRQNAPLQAEITNQTQHYLTTGKVDVNARWDSRTPLSCATENGHEGIVKRLFATGKVDVEVNDECSVPGGSYSGGSCGGGDGDGWDWEWN